MSYLLHSCFFNKRAHRELAWGVLDKLTVGYRFPLLTCRFQEALLKTRMGKKSFSLGKIFFKNFLREELQAQRR